MARLYLGTNLYLVGQKKFGTQIDLAHDPTDCWSCTGGKEVRPSSALLPLGAPKCSEILRPLPNSWRN